jgi:hypothetical protein
MLPIDHDVSALLHAAEARPNMIARPAKNGIASEHPTTCLKIFDITNCLRQRQRGDADTHDLAGQIPADLRQRGIA